MLTDTHPPVTVLLDPHDTAATTHQLLAAHDPAAGVVVVHPTPGVSAVRGLGADVVAALGRSIGRLAPERISGPDAIWNAVAAWITADAITHLIVLRAHRLSDRQRAQLLHLRWTTGVHLSLVWHAPLSRPGPELDLVGIPHRISDDVSALLTAPAVRRPRTRSPVDGPDLPAVPPSEFEQFRAEAFRSLDPTEFQAVDAVYVATMGQVCAQLTSHPLAGSCWGHPIVTVWHERARHGDDSPHTGRLPGRRSPHSNRPRSDYDRIAARDQFARWSDLRWLRTLLGELITDSPGPNYTITRLRAAQAAFGLHAWQLNIANLPYTVGPGLTTTPLTSVLAERIRSRIASPVRAAGLVATLATGAPPHELRALRGDGLTDDGAVIVSGDHLYTMPPPARPMLLASRTYIQLNAPDRKGLLNDGIGASGRTVRASADLCGIRLPARLAWPLTWIAHANARRYWPRLRPSDDADLRYALGIDIASAGRASHPRRRSTPLDSTRSPGRRG